MNYLDIESLENDIKLLGEDIYCQISDINIPKQILDDIKDEKVNLTGFTDCVVLIKIKNVEDYLNGFGVILSLNKYYKDLNIIRYQEVDNSIEKNFKVIIYLKMRGR